MNVREMIARLQEFDGDLPVTVYDPRLAEEFEVKANDVRAGNSTYADRSDTDVQAPHVIIGGL